MITIPHSISFTIFNVGKKYFIERRFRIYEIPKLEKVSQKQIIVIKYERQR